MKTEMQMLNDEVKKANIIYWVGVVAVAVAFGNVVGLLTYALMS